MTGAIYNEIDPFASRWLGALIAGGHIAAGTVDSRSITNLKPADVSGPGQRHFFAGIGGWSYALRLAGVPDDADIWTGSCPCQPFSDAGARGGVRDPRHLWPAWFELIRECRPPTIFGEQVASRDGLGWLDLVRADLERCGYAFGASDLCAAGVGAPHIRQRLFFVAHANGQHGRLHAARWEPGRANAQAGRRSEAGPLGYASGARSGRNPGGASRAQAEVEREGEQHRRERDLAVDAGAVDWRDAEWIPCSDGTSRPVEPGTFPLASRIPGRVGLLRGYGNSIVPQVTAMFIRAALGIP